MPYPELDDQQKCKYFVEQSVLAWHDVLLIFPLMPMMSLEQIIALNDKIASEALQKRLQPYQPSGPEEAVEYPPFPFPNLGQVPEGWEEAESFWVDKTGVGRSSEPALTVEQFRTLLYDHISDHPDHAYAITEEGPFQVVVSALRKTRAKVAEQLGD